MAGGWRILTTGSGSATTPGGRQLTQVELAAQAHLSQGYLAAVEGSLKANPSLETLKKLAKALHVPVTELLA